MILLVSSPTGSAKRYWGHPHMGWLVCPRDHSQPKHAAEAGMPWAADNDAFSRFDRDRYITMLKRIASVDRSHFLFVTAPDVVGNASATLTRWRMWLPVLRYYDLPAAFVLQDGQAIESVPWDDCTAVFVGGSTRFKLVSAVPLIREAKRRGKWVHVGRVSSTRRKVLLDVLAVDSIDGSRYSRWPDDTLPGMLSQLPYKQYGLEGILC